MRSRRVSSDTLLLLALLLGFTFLAFSIGQTGQEGEEQGDPRRTTYSARPGGWKAWFLLLQERGLRPERLEVPPEEWPEEARLVISGTPYFGVRQAMSGEASLWTPEEAEAALKWVEQGGTLLLFDEKGSAFTQKLKLEVEEVSREVSPLNPLQPAAFLAGVRRVAVPGSERWVKTPRSAVPLLSNGKPALVVIARKKGLIFACASAALAENRSLLEADNARFVAQLAESYAPEDGTVFFDEFHQGYSQSRSFWDALGRPGQWAAYQVLVLILLIAYSASRRFGLPQPLPPSPRVSSEYVSAVASLYQKAGARDAALEAVYRSFLHDLCRAVGLPPDTPAQDIASQAASAMGRIDLRTPLFQLLEACEKRSDEAVQKKITLTDAELLQFVRDLEQMRKELQLGGRQ